MSSVALKLLTLAYENYVRTGATYFEYVPHNGDDQFFSSEGARQLFKDGYISNVSDFVFSDAPDNVGSPICFTLEKLGIEYGRSNGEL